LNVPEALRVASIEAARRQDVDTLDAYAWALGAAGDFAEARKQMDKAMAWGLAESPFTEHARFLAAH
jgi:hypothetical protein